MPHSHPLSNAFLLLAGSLLGACSAGHSPGSEATGGEILAASPWIAGGRRAALRAASPGTTLVLEVPEGATGVRLEVVALRSGGLPLRRAARVGLRAGEAEPVTARLPVREAASAAWTPLTLDLPEGQERLELSASPGGADLIWWSRPRFEGLAPAGARNLLLVSLDTTRADAIGHLGQVLDTTPHLDALAERGTTWTEAIAPSSWTLPTHVSVMTGRGGLGRAGRAG